MNAIPVKDEEGNITGYAVDGCCQRKDVHEATDHRTATEIEANLPPRANDDKYEMELWWQLDHARGAYLDALVRLDFYRRFEVER